MSKELRVATTAALKAGEMLMEHYGKVHIKYKPDKSVVTEADIRSEETIKSILEKEFPRYSVLGEESGYIDRDSNYLWVVDPLDGTTNYKIRNPFFSVSIGLMHIKEPVLGVVYYPHQKEVFQAEKDKGAYLNDERIHVSGEDNIENSALTFCHGRDKESTETTIDIFRKLKRINHKVRQIGSASLELCYVACGRTEAFLMPGSNSWDVAAGALIVREAYGMVSDFSGEPFNTDLR
ncbi:MAG: inositol monophosphatase, partial [Nitrososphaeria archaeon]|nr:inositol monophosphatase [Nitrososphaeria archaeon]NIN52452.1 inositol monophosphatase [Nitrososphaeria archaeon]NIQ33591.1 inositol monophosphatase [Nitrososphaeria archaeon]